VVTLHGISAVVIDIEGTTSRAGFIYDVLFPYSRARMADWIGAHRDSDVVREISAQTRELLSVGDLSEADLVAALVAWIDSDTKAAPLKTAQGEIWAEGYSRGELKSQLFDDVAPALHAWHDAGLALYIYSSGSTKAQQNWFANSPAGDLTAILSGYFDINTAGPKRESASYVAIAEAIAQPAPRIVFLSDAAEELAAATAAGWQTVGLSRDGEPYAHNTPAEFTWVNSFADINLS
jgi:enolase-phosphatase E1